VAINAEAEAAASPSAAKVREAHSILLVVRNGEDAGRSGERS
jgi:hypothetical protein